MKINSIVIILYSIVFGLFLSCGNDVKKTKDGKLPILGFTDEVDGETIYHSIPDFSFINQDSAIVTNESFKDKVYVTDFFFTYCPSICPIVTKQMLRLYDEFETEDRLKFLSHTLDVEHDTPPVLKAYADDIHISSDRWHLVTGEDEAIFEMAEKYFIVAKKDPDAPGGFDHSGKLILVDEDRHVRAFCEGTDPEEVTAFMDDIRKLLNEKK